MSPKKWLCNSVIYQWENYFPAAPAQKSYMIIKDFTSCLQQVVNSTACFSTAALPALCAGSSAPSALHSPSDSAPPLTTGPGGVSLHISKYALVEIHWSPSIWFNRNPQSWKTPQIHSKIFYKNETLKRTHLHTIKLLGLLLANRKRALEHEAGFVRLSDMTQVLTYQPTALFPPTLMQNHRDFSSPWWKRSHRNPNHYPFIYLPSKCCLGI